MTIWIGIVAVCLDGAFEIMGYVDQGAMIGFNGIQRNGWECACLQVFFTAISWTDTIQLIGDTATIFLPTVLIPESLFHCDPIQFGISPLLTKVFDCQISGRASAVPACFPAGHLSHLHFDSIRFGHAIIRYHNLRSDPFSRCQQGVADLGAEGDFSPTQAQASSDLSRRHWSLVRMRLEWLRQSCLYRHFLKGLVVLKSSRS